MSSDTAVVDFKTDLANDPSSNPAQVSANDDREPVLFYGSFPGHKQGDKSGVSVAQALLKPSESLSADSVQRKALDEKCILRAPRRDPDLIRTDLAFGNGDGTSAYVNENGELISIVEMLDMGPDGLFQARPNYRPRSGEDPFSFHDIIQGRRSGMGLSLVHDDLDEHGSNQIDFVHDRWPRISYRYPKWDLEIQLAIKDRRVIQHYTLRSRNRVKVKFAFNAANIIDHPYRPPHGLKGDCHVRGGVFTTGASAITLAGGAGGHVRFIASLFKDAQSTRLDLSPEKAPLSDQNPPPPGYSYSIEPTDRDRSDWASNLIQEFAIDMFEGETRTVTAIYYFECERWGRDQVYSLHLMPEYLQGDNEKKQREKEKEFMEEYERIKTDEDYDRARRLLDKGMQTLLDTNLEELDGKNLEQREAQKWNKIVPFSNWGGEALSSQRLFGLEWKSDEHGNRLMSLQSRSAFDKKFAQVRENISDGHVPQFVNAHDFLLSSCCGHWHASLGDEKSSFLFRRHLQHLLFVAAIPVPWENDEKTAYWFSDGSLFGTRTDRPTSLDKFRFLTDMYRLLKGLDIADPNLEDFLQSCILRICKGHLEWCFDIAQIYPSKTWTSRNRLFGSRISDESDLTTGAIHFLKLFEAFHTLDLGNEYISQTLAKRLDGWLGLLHSSRNQKSGLWAAFEKDEDPPNLADSYSYPYSIKLPCYDLCHSVLIWQAISAVHAMMGLPHCKSSVFRKDMISSEELQAVILKRFSYDHTFPTLESLQTYQESVLGHNAKNEKQRLLAFSRNGTEKPRFHWNAQSMILCEGYDWGIFAKPRSSKRTNESRLYEAQERLDEWWSSLKLQTFQHAALWKKPNRYLLALIVASNSGFSFDKTIEAEKMVKQCSEILLRSVLVDGRIAAEIDPLTQSPLSNLSVPADSSFIVPHYLLRQQYPENLLRSFSKPMDVGDLDAKESEWTQKDLRRNYRHEKSVRSLRKRGFYAFVDKTQVFENPCEPDWLFYDPDIFTTEVRSCDQDALQAVVTKWQDIYDDSNLIPEDIKDFIGRLTRFWDANKIYFQQESRKNLAIVDDIVRVDVKGSRKGVSESLCWSREMLVLLRSAREKSEIKKRLISVHHCTTRMAMNIIFGAVGVEQYYIPEFVMRHQKRGVFLRDETRKRINTWVTELHISFYSIIAKPNTDSESDSDDDDDDYYYSESHDPSLFDEGLRPCPGKPDSAIEKSIVSIHFFGDLNDRYWTSHVFVHIPDDRWFADDTSFELAKPSGEGNKNTFHSQRKILEARWFAKATKHVVGETKRILEYVSDVTGKDKDDNSFFNSGKYDTFKKTFEQNKKTYALYGDLIKLLFEVKQSLRAVQAITKEWDNRADFREVQPRWTQDDEAAYREEIRLSTFESKGHVYKIQSLLGRIEGLIEHVTQLRQWLLDDLSLKEARMSNRSADDVRIFTYATVIFLPLSFVSSVFSMAGAPDRATVRPFIIAAVVALLATIAFLLNAGTPMRNIAYYKNEFLHLPQDDSILEHADSQWKAVLRTFHSWLIRLPAQNVLVARDILVARQKSHQKLRKWKKSVAEETHKDQSRRAKFKQKQIWRQENSKIVIGILVLPLFLLGIALRFISQNLFDVVKLLFFTLPRYSNRRLEREISTEEEDRKSVLSRDSPSANEQAKKNIKRDDMGDEQRRRQDLRAKEAKYHDSNLERFIAIPRIGDLEQYLQKGETLGAAREKLKAKRKESKRNFKDVKKKYMKARKKIVGKEITTEGKVSEVDVEIDISSDDSSDNETNPSRWDKAHRFGLSISRFFTSQLAKAKQLDGDAEKAGV